MKYPTLDQAQLSGKTVLLRAGFDVPITDGVVTDTARIDAVTPTMKKILDEGAALVIMAHQGRPTPRRQGYEGQEGERNPEMSQRPLVPVLEKILGVPVQFADHCCDEKAKLQAHNLQPGEVLLLENLRYEAAEKSKEVIERDKMGKALADLADIYVNDAFSNAHRDHASMTSVPKYIPGYLGLNIQHELEGLIQVTDNPKRPLTLIISGAKIETKVPVIKQFLDKGDDILVGGCIANTLIAARGFDVGVSKWDDTYKGLAQELMLASESDENATIHIPRDVIVSSNPKDHAVKVDIPVEDIEGDMGIYDVGAVTIERYKEIIAQSGTIVWNGPLGLYEINSFSHASKRIAEAIAEATKNGATSIVGGGDTLDFHERYNYSLDDYTFVSTAGGAMLDYISGKKLPALEALTSK
ncbi:phosphoglycerate kinase [Candidatus Peregrinibacteria bacterium]|jgi:phosphoglycerate kinase|nr:phosphoglycerate kinase [Candidatus Peregrinibacteria bacterium]MBT5468760.1 phosphoglycerate kinase [Candidatus Peregrinibacteria bacterium]MBT7337854.1 phosphoglycerate kinase [Candidatus Peregrinibacteria bacterium]